ncbi:alcohol dehydrogenase GroES domain-containing protein [Deinococcus aerius]|uniref:Alcohol dehydrogenase GroES domain-containing protein n=1 Tax=Deinococcus aerius TaxID=200253 RepID=A0A2I9DTQ6_9DEIO|nr:zinc-dependent alcohol dehydrogenase [Deinococcus aerius]GBF06037.1 alcohol dehydrogenase GroES domain-containing protein [Deinococcus aerius]
MKAVVWHGIGDIRLDDVPEPRIEQPTDATVRLTASAICGTDLHFVRGTGGEMVPGTILGHEGVGIVEEVGPDVRNFRPGDRVVIPSTIACGYCSYCRAGYYAQCDTANPHGPLAGTAFYGGPKMSGPFQGLQAEKARIPFAATNLVKVPDSVTDQQAILVSDIFPTGYFGADLADIKPGHTVAVFGCGPVGQFTITSAKLMGAGRVFAIDRIPSRLDTARYQGAETINFDEEDPVEALRRLTGGIGVDCAIDVVGVDAKHADHGPAAAQARQEEGQFEQEVQQVAPQGTAWNAGNAPSQALEWAVQGLAKAGTLSIIGVYPQTMQSFPIGMAMNKNLTIRMGNCNHRKYIPDLLDLIQSGALDPEKLLSQVEEMHTAVEAYHAFDERQPGWLKVELVPGM